LADAELEKVALKPEHRRAAVRHLQRVLGVSEQFACRVAGQHRATQRYEPVTATPHDPDATLRSWLRHYAKDRAEGWAVNHEEMQCLWREEVLRVPQRRRHKGHGSSAAPAIVIADAPNRVWAVDLRFGVTTDGRPIKIVSIVDEHTGECLGGMVERSITGARLIAELSRLERLSFAVDQFTGSGHGHWAPPHGSVLCYPPAGGRGITACLTPYFTV
jgi:hypothetical protein